MAAAETRTAFEDSRIATDSLRVSNANPPRRWTQNTYLLRRNRFRYESHRRVLTDELIVDKASLTSGARMVAQLDEGVLHLGVYKLRGGRFMHVDGPLDDLCSVTLGGGLWEAVVQEDSEGLLLLVQGDLALQLLESAHHWAAKATHRHQDANQSFVLAPSLATRQLAQLIEEALGEVTAARRAAIARDLATVVERLLPNMVPLMAAMPQSHSQRRRMALHYEQRIWDMLPSRGTLPDIAAETCEAFGLTKRSLQLAVREHFGLSCEALQRTIRLNYAHLLLSDTTAARNVTDAALAAGFAHMGRFSQQYRSLFGESPSGTLAAAG